MRIIPAESATDNTGRPADHRATRGCWGSREHSAVLLHWRLSFLSSRAQDYEKSLRLDPKNEGAREMLKKIKEAAGSE